LTLNNTSLKNGCIVARQSRQIVSFQATNQLQHPKTTLGYQISSQNYGVNACLF